MYRTNNYTLTRQKSKVFMTNCALVCEYNPFHSGHKYQLDRIRPSVDNILCIMSGSFVQAAEPAFCDKALRTECALLGGADAVIELSAVFATASAQWFAEGSARIVAEIADIKYWAMGAVSDKDVILRLAEVRSTHKSEFETLLKDRLDDGRSYAHAAVAAVKTLCARLYPSVDISSALNDPNDILCLEYIAATEKFAANVQPLIVRRRGAIHGDMSLDGEHASATAIRAAVADGKSSEVKRFMPYGYDKIAEWRSAHSPDVDAFKKAAVFALKSSTAERLASLRDCSEGMEYLLKKSDLSDYDGIIKNTATRRYGEKRLKRLLLDALLGIERYDGKKLCTRLLGCKNGFDFSVLPRSVKTNNRDIKHAVESDAELARTVAIDERAAALYNTICGVDGGYYNYSLVKV